MNLDSLGSFISVVISLSVLILTMIKQPHEIASVDAQILVSYSKTLGETAEELRKSRLERSQMTEEFDTKISELRAEHGASLKELNENHAALIQAKDERINQVECDSAKSLNQLNLQIATMQSQIASLLLSKEDLDRWAHQLVDQVQSMNGVPIPFRPSEGG